MSVMLTQSPETDALPHAVLFACTRNAIRSPMAEALLKHLAGTRIYVDSAGVLPGEPDGFAMAAMKEKGLDITAHQAKSFDELWDTSFDLVISLSPEAHHRALEMTRTMAIDAEYWPTLDPSVIDGKRDERLQAYRQCRDQLAAKLQQRFPSL
ncbi:MAG: arsenate reductase ArsC [Alphaproteobacteria bacterium]